MMTRLSVLLITCILSVYSLPFPVLDAELAASPLLHDSRIKYRGGSTGSYNE